MAEAHPHVLAYLRHGSTETALIVLNLSGHSQRVTLPADCIFDSRSALSNYEPRTPEETMRLSPYEAHLWFRKHN